MNFILHSYQIQTLFSNIIFLMPIKQHYKITYMMNILNSVYFTLLLCESFG